MHIVLVHIHVIPEHLDAFRKATLDNARSSIQEPGILRFDVLQQGDDPARFVLVEVYQAPEDQEKHRQTAHYNRWKELVTDMMAEPRLGIKYSPLFPDENGWV